MMHLEIDSSEAVDVSRAPLGADTVQAALTARAARHRLAIDATRLGTWSWDPATNTVTVDDRTRHLLGLTEADIRSPDTFIAAHVHPDDREPLLTALKTATDPSGDGRFQGEYRIVHSDGTERWALAFARMHFAGKGANRQAARLIGTVLDVTEQKHADVRHRVLARLGANGLATDDETLLQRLADAAVADLADWAIVDVIDPAAGTTRQAAMAHVDPAKLDILRELTALYPPDPTRPTLGRVAVATGRPQLYTEAAALLASVAQDAEQARLTRLLGTRSAIVVPLQTHDGPFGVAAFGSGRRSFTPEDLSIAEELGRRASLAVENARLVAAAGRARLDAERAAMRTSRLQTLSAALAAALTPNDVAVAAVREGVAAVGADAGVLVLLTPDGRSLEVMHFEGYEAQRIERWRRFPIDAPAPLAEAVRTGEPVVIASHEDRARRYPGLAAVSPARYPSSISVPLMAEGRCFGALGLSFREQLDVRPEDRELLLAVARQCAQAVRRATLFDAEAVARATAEAAGRRLAFLADASAALASLDYEATLQHVARLAVPAFADFAVIDILDRDGALQRVAYAHVDPAKEPLLGEMARHPLRAGEVAHPLRARIDAGEPVLIAEVTDELLQRMTRSSGYAADAWALDPRSLIIAPLPVHGATLGAMTFGVSEPGRRYTASDLAVAAEVARRAATAVDNARLYRQSEAARRDAEAANRAKGQFLAVMSHELRTPLNAILGYSELVQMGIHGPVTDAQREAMSRIRRSGQHLLSLVNNVLSLERAEAGVVATELATLPVSELFEDADALARAQAGAKGLTLTVVPPPNGTLVLGEREKVGQVLANLLSNAVKFTLAGGRITLRCDVDEHSVHLRVSDSGIGIPANALDRVFRPFVQLDSGLTRRAEGAGLGLAISRSLARLMGGELSAESTVGVGSTFTLMLVRAPVESADEPG